MQRNRHASARFVYVCPGQGAGIDGSPVSPTPVITLTRTPPGRRKTLTGNLLVTYR